ncbi:MAG: hypothetical protein WAQ08_10855 [Aquabacterium sp.]|uniref:hypothetical protein n=1 Tax=Aquabacterium sp. TaxID=1872578 RepID=UPI003BB0C4B3
MNRHLNELSRRSVPQPSPASIGGLPNPPRRHSWRTWTLLAALVFGVYVIGGDFVLKDEYQWSAVSGRITGKTVAAATVAATPAKASEAAAITTAQEEARVAPAIKIAEGAETAKVQPTVDIARQTAAIEVDKHDQLAAIDVHKQAAINTLEAAKVSQIKAAEAYRDCQARAHNSADSAAAHPPSRYGTLGSIDAARTIALARAQESCESLKPQEDAALSAADTVTPRAKQ